MNKIPVFFEEAMQQKNNSFSPSSSKPKLVVEDWLKCFPDFVEVKSFSPLKKEDFYLVHDQDHVDGVFDGSIANGFSIKDSSFAPTFLYTSGSLYQAALEALKGGIAVSPTSGFHHAEYAQSMGFCTFNGLVLGAKKIYDQGLAKKIGILDFDMHYGNGTDDLINRHQLDYIEHYTAGQEYDLYFPHWDFLKPVIKKVYNRFFAVAKKHNGTNPSAIRKRLLKNLGKVFIKQIPEILEPFKDCDLIIYQAGADQHINDPYGGLVTYEQMKQRDKMVFEFSKKHNIPLVWNLAGGYQRDENGSIEPVLLCHRNTMDACIEIYKK